MNGYIVVCVVTGSVFNLPIVFLCLAFTARKERQNRKQKLPIQLMLEIGIGHRILSVHSGTLPGYLHLRFLRVLHLLHQGKAI